MNESDKEYLQRKCDSIDKQINQLVYQLYGLTEEEIKIVEEIGKGKNKNSPQIGRSGATLP